MIDHTRSYRIFSVFNYLLLAMMGILSVVPLIHILAVSLSSRAPAQANQVGLWPIGFTLEAYEKTLNNAQFGMAFLNGVLRTALGTATSMAVITPAAFALSKDESEFRGRTLYTWFFLFSMMFTGGLIPTYIIVRQVGLMNSIGALILPTAVNVWNMILLMNFFRASVPKALAEAAMIDGANHFTTLIKVYLPISLPAIATISLFTMVFHWNSWFDGLIYITESSRIPLATFLQSIIVQQDFSLLRNPEDLANIANRTVKASQIFIAMIPVLLVYPFLQRYFVKGIVLGSIKE